MKEFSLFRIKIQGEIPESWSDRLQGMSITVSSLEEDGTVTTLFNPLRDQAALSGVLNTLYDMHVPIPVVERVRKQEE